MTNTELVSSNLIDDYDALSQFISDSQTSLSNMQTDYTNLEAALTNTPESNTSRRAALQTQMNTNIADQKQLNTVIGAAMDVASTNDANARQNLAQSLATLSVLDTELNDASYNIGILNQDQINKARMADINTNTSKENNAYINLFKMISMYLLCILVLAVLGRYVPAIKNITKMLCLIVILLMIVHVCNSLYDIYRRSATNYDEYNWSKPKTTTTSSSSPPENNYPTTQCNTNVAVDASYSDASYTDLSGVELFTGMSPARF